MTGSISYHAGLAAEDIVSRFYQAKGLSETCRRWRTRHGEVDLVLADGDQVVFVEVKKSKDFASAVQRITSRQMARIHNAALEYLAASPSGFATVSRIDVALVNYIGEVRVIENVSVQ